MAKWSKARKAARPAASKPAPTKAAPPKKAAIAKSKHVHFDLSASSQGGGASRKLQLVRKLEAGRPAAASSARAKKRAKNAANASALGAVGGIAASLDELMAASDARARGSASTHAQDGGVSLTSKKRQQLVVEETQHLQAVLDHPAFKADPFAALQEHLNNTVAPSTDERKRNGKKR
ncbi:hypothetical protein AB1Y20_002196 [Prymnesium parvum]|uniref:Ribosome biogenesis protein SLX9 n=1 Tax=Prymnesium parvum TaxID=97485 RepID=A0AB34J8P8_PRYPA